MHHYLNVAAGLLSSGQQNALTFNWAGVRYQHAAAIAARVQEDYKPATAITILAALRRVLKEAWRLGLIDAEEYRRAVDLRPIRGESLLKGRALELGEIRGLMEACSKDLTAAGARDAALIAVLYGAGLRRSEIAKLELGDYDSATGALKLLNAKGGKDRISYLEPV